MHFEANCAQVINCVPRVCGDDPKLGADKRYERLVFPAYAGMILKSVVLAKLVTRCSPRMRG